MTKMTNPLDVYHLIQCDSICSWEEQQEYGKVNHLSQSTVQLEEYSISWGHGIWQDMRLIECEDYQWPPWPFGWIQHLVWVKELTKLLCQLSNSTLITIKKSWGAIPPATLLIELWNIGHLEKTQQVHRNLPWYYWLTWVPPGKILSNTYLEPQRFGLWSSACGTDMPAPLTAVWQVLHAFPVQVN